MKRILQVCKIRKIDNLTYFHSRIIWLLTLIEYFQKHIFRKVMRNMSEKITFKIIKICVMTMDVALISITCGFETFQDYDVDKILKKN